jgi:uncharacterized protein (TIGR02118 family)
MSKEQFVTYLIEKHAPMAKSIPGIRAYNVQEALPVPSRKDIVQLKLPELDGFAEIWVEDINVYQAMKKSREGREWFADRLNFVGAMKSLVTKEDIVVPVPRPLTMARNNAFVNKNPAYTMEEFIYHWHVGHGPSAKTMPYLKGFVLCDVIDEILPDDITAVESDIIHGCAQAFFDSPEEELKMIATPEAKEWFKHGAVTFGNIKAFGAKETQIIPF